jgi:hypothetical protein
VESAAASVSRTKTAPAPASCNCSTPVKFAGRHKGGSFRRDVRGRGGVAAGASLELVQHANEPLVMFQSSSRFHVHENGLGHLEMAASLASSIFSMLVGNDFQQPRGNQETRHFQCSACPPLRGHGAAEHRRPARAVEIPASGRTVSRQIVPARGLVHFQLVRHLAIHRSSALDQVLHPRSLSELDQIRFPSNTAGRLGGHPEAVSR